MLLTFRHWHAFFRNVVRPFRVVRHEAKASHYKKRAGTRPAPTTRNPESYAPNPFDKLMPGPKNIKWQSSNVKSSSKTKGQNEVVLAFKHLDFKCHLGFGPWYDPSGSCGTRPKPRTTKSGRVQDPPLRVEIPSTKSLRQAQERPKKYQMTKLKCQVKLKNQRTEWITFSI